MEVYGLKSKIFDIIAKGESSNTEFKETYNSDSKGVIKTVIAFSNTIGGTILFGVSDTGEIKGVENRFNMADSIVNAISNNCQPQIVPMIDHIDIEGKHIVSVTIPPGPLRPYHMKNRSKDETTYVRIGATSRTADPETISDLTFQGRNKSYDLDVFMGTIKEKDEERFLADLSKRSKSEIDADAMDDLGLLREGSKTNALALFSGAYKRRVAKCTLFRGTDRISIIDSADYGGGLLDQYDSCLAFTVRNLRNISEFRKDVREDRCEIPVEAIREIIVNAIVHRNYQIESASIMISIFDDRVEIDSPGLFPYGMTEEDSRMGKSIIRNPAIANVFAVCGLFEGRGIGLRKARDACLNAGLPEPAIEQAAIFVRITLFKDVAKAKKFANADLSNAENNVLEAIKSNPEASTLAEISDITGISRPMVSKCTSLLATKGYISRVGGNRSGRWVVL